MIRTDTAVRSLVVSLVGGILAATSIPLGIVFVVLGLVLADQEAFLYVGLFLAVTGLIEGGVALIWRRRVKAQDAAETAARISQTRARVLEAILNPSSRVGALSPMHLAVELGGGRQARKVYVPVTTNWQPGMEIQVAYAPNDPGNFVPLMT
ncbi:hypothetical protein [Solirubrobacter soli]|uniref:hypothetical protein n=1 Tax=Solirubrobacter soli TaxID=363832 RepID=UPI000416A1B6|nr:hypothetical protein [Solirubrobacter soli]